MADSGLDHAAQEAALAEWIAASPDRQKQYGDVLPGLARLQADGEKVRERTAVMGNLTAASQYLAAAQTLYRLSVQRTKPDLDRDAGFQDRDLPSIRERLDRLQRTLDASSDRALLRWAMGLAIAHGLAFTLTSGALVGLLRGRARRAEP